MEFSSNLVEDLKRRDFTINAMAYNEQQGLVDVFEGIEDMQRKVIRCVGNPKERFGEDALRMMRAIRFSAQLGFEIEEETYRAVEEDVYKRQYDDHRMAMAFALLGIRAEGIVIDNCECLSLIHI